MVRALHHGLERVAHVVAQVVEAELVVGAVGDVAGVGLAPLRVVQAGHDHAHAQAQELVDRTHPGGVAAGQIVVHGDDMDALAAQRVEVGRQRRDQRLALAGAHLGDAALVQHHAADQLHVEVPLPQRALGGLAHHGEGLDLQVVQGLALLQPLPELAGLGTERLVGQIDQRRFERIDPVDRLAHGLDQTVVRRAEQPPSNGAEHEREFLPRSASGRERANVRQSA